MRYWPVLRVDADVEASTVTDEEDVAEALLEALRAQTGEPCAIAVREVRP